MQLDVNAIGQISDGLRALPPLMVRAFGRQTLLEVTGDQYLRDDSYWRVRSIYEPALAAQSLALQGVALDVGAGYGCFCVPFALAFPDWTVWAFEPEAEAFAALRRNITNHKVTNIVAVNAAVSGPRAADPEAAIGDMITQLAKSGPNDAGLARLLSLLPLRDFRRHIDMRGVIEAGSAVGPDFEPCAFPALSADALVGLRPNLLKLTAPFSEIEVLDGLRLAPLDHVIGESWTHLPASAVYDRPQGLWQTWIPRAGDPKLRLQRSKPMTGLRMGLDVVVAMYNSKAWIKDCIDGILQDLPTGIRVLVVDDGSTDGSGDLVQADYAGHKNVVLLRKQNGGCASARNFGRMNSDASHIAFVDADDVPGPGLFSGLLELARHTGAEVVQGGFELLEVDPNGLPDIKPSYEMGIEEITQARRHSLGASTCLFVPAWLLIQGQPTIWRRVYRRDYLDNRNIWFPEHIRAFDDQLFQLLTLQQVHDVPMLDGVAYRYRQHDLQDIKQGDERSFYSLEMFRMMLKRGVSEGWNDFRPMLQSFMNTVNWSWTGLRPDLRPAFERGAAELWVYAQNTLGESAFTGLPETGFSPPDFPFYSSMFRTKLKALNQTYGSVYLDSSDMHVAMITPRHR